MARFRWNGKEGDTERDVVSPRDDPAGRRIIQRAGRRARQWLSRGYHIEVNHGVPELVPGDRAFVNDRGETVVRNPLTNRPIVRGGRVHRNLCNHGWEDGPGGDGGMVRSEDLLRLPLGFYHAGDLIRQLENLVATYQWDCDYSSLRLISTDDTVKIENHPPRVADLIGARKDILHLDESDPQGVYNLLSQGINVFAGFEIISPRTNRAAYQFLAAGDLDGLCVRRCLEALAPDEDWTPLEECCSSDDMSTIIGRYSCTIRAVTHYFVNEPLYEWRPGNNNHKGRIFYLFYVSTHTLPLLSGPPVFPDYNDPNVPREWLENEDEAIEEMERMTFVLGIPTRPTAANLRPKYVVCGFSTPTTHFKVRFERCEEVPTAWSHGGAAYRILEREAGGRLNTPAKLVPYLQHVVHSGVRYRTTLAEPTPTYHDDQCRSYASYHLCPYYSGFIDLKRPIDVVDYDPDVVLGTPTVNADGLVEYKGTEYEGLVRVTREGEWPRESTFHKPEMWVAFAHVRYETVRGGKFRGHEMIVGLRADYDPFEAVKKEMGEDRKSIFNKVVGRAYSSRVVDVVVARSADEYDALRERGFSLIRKIERTHPLWICEYRRGNRKLCDDCVWRKFNAPESYAEAKAECTRCRYIKERVSGMALWSAMIHSYQKLTFAIDVIPKLLDKWDRVVRIDTDGVDLLEPLGCELPPERWKPEVQRTIDPQKATPSVYLERSVWSQVPRPRFNPLYFAQRLLFIGPPGCGKTHQYGAYWGKYGRKIVLTAPLHTAALQLGPEAMTTHKLVELKRSARAVFDKMMRGSEGTVIDEVGMCPRYLLEELMEPGLPPLRCSGDFEQLLHPEAAGLEWYRENDWVVVEMEGNQRATDARTRELQAACRGRSTREIVEILRDKIVDVPDQPRLWENFLYIASTNAEVEEATKKIVASLPPGEEVHWGGCRRRTPFQGPLNRSEDPEYNLLRRKRSIRCKILVGMRVIAVSSVKGLKNQEAGFIVAINSSMIRVRRCSDGVEVDVPLDHLLPGYAVTYHRCQSQTYDFHIYASLRNIFDRRMLYVAVTRVTHHGYLHLVRNRAARA